MSKYMDMAVMYTSEYGLKIVAAIVILIIGKWAVHKITSVTKAMMHKAKIDRTLIEFAESLIYFVLLMMVVLASLNALGINTTSFIAVFGAASLAIGLALQGSLANVGAAVLIIIFRPFKVGDFVSAGGATETVEDVNLFSTIIAPVDNRTIIVPNANIIGGNIINYSKKPTRRVDHTFGIGYDDDLKLAKDTLMQILKDDSRVLSDPEPFVAVGELGDNSVNCRWMYTSTNKKITKTKKMKKIALSIVLLSVLAQAEEISPELAKLNADIETATIEKKAADDKLKALKEKLPQDTAIKTDTKFGYAKTDGNTDTETLTLDSKVKKEWGLTALHLL